MVTKNRARKSHIQSLLDFPCKPAHSRIRLRTGSVPAPFPGRHRPPLDGVPNRKIERLYDSVIRA